MSKYPSSEDYMKHVGKSIYSRAYEYCKLYLRIFFPTESWVGREGGISLKGVREEVSNIEMDIRNPQRTKESERQTL